MEHIWSPWRMKFIEKARKGHKCIFCTSPDNVRKNLILFKGKHCYIIMNRYPYNNGHLMVVPYDHVAEISNLRSEIQQELIWLTGESVRILKKILKCQGANCGMNIGDVAGAGIAGHVHMHVVPRWLGDSNFMPIIGKAKSMPEYLEDTYKKLLVSFSVIPVRRGGGIQRFLK